MRLMTWQTLSISPYRHRHHRFPDGMPLQHAQTARRRRRPPRHARPRASPGVTRAWPGASRAALEVASVHPAAADAAVGDAAGGAPEGVPAHRGGVAAAGEAASDAAAAGAGVVAAAAAAVAVAAAAAVAVVRVR